MKFELETKDVVRIKPQWVEIVRLLSDGRKVSEIATELEMNVRTLETEIGRIKHLCGCNTIGQLTVFFWRKKFIK